MSACSYAVHSVCPNFLFFQTTPPHEDTFRSKFAQFRCCKIQLNPECHSRQLISVRLRLNIDITAVRIESVFWPYFVHKGLPVLRF